MIFLWKRAVTIAKVSNKLIKMFEFQNKLIFNNGFSNFKNVNYVPYKHPEENDEQTVGLSEANRTRCIILPSNKLKKAWDFYVMLLLVYVALVIPYRVCFNIEDKSTFGIVFDLWFDASFAIDIIMTFFSAYYSKEKLVVNKTQIAKRYLKGWFWLDVITTIPF